MENLRDSEFPHISSNSARDKLVRDLLQLAHTHGQNPERDAKVEEAWNTRFGLPFQHYKPAATYLRGFPGQGKTTAFKEAAREVAELLGMNLIDQPETACPVTVNDLVLSVVNLSGEVSNLAVSGVPHIEKHITSVESTGPGMDDVDNAFFYTKRTPPFPLAAASMAGLAVVVLDDMPNASPNIQNIANDLLDLGRAQGLDLGPRTLVGATGNLGSEDATHVNSTSTATATRVNNYQVQDMLQDWCDRVIRQYPDTIGDAGLVAFMEKNADLFHVPTKRKKGEPYPTARSWSKALEEHLRPMFGYFQSSLNSPSQRDAVSRYLDTTIKLAGGLIGMKAADKLGGYYRSLLDHSLPLANEVMETGTLSNASKQVFKDNYQDGVSAKSEYFLTTFYSTLTDNAATKLVQHYLAGNWDQFNTLVNHYMTGLYSFAHNAAHLGWVAHYFSNRLISLANDPEVGSIVPDTQSPVLDTRFLDRFVKAVSGHTDACAVVRDNVTVFEDTFLTAMVDLDESIASLLRQDASVPSISQPIKTSSTAPRM